MIPVALTLADAPELARLHATGFAPGDRWLETSFVELIRSGAYGWMLPGAFLLARRVLDEVEILTLVVDPALQRQGRARALLQQLITHSDGDRIFLEVSESNQPACALYHQFGFTPFGRRPHYYADGSAALTMALIVKKPM